MTNAMTSAQANELARDYISSDDELTKAQRGELQVALHTLGYETHSIKKDGTGDGSFGRGFSRAALEYIQDQHASGQDLDINNPNVRSALRNYRLLDRAGSLNSTGIPALIQYEDMTRQETMRLTSLLGLDAQDTLDDNAKHELINFIAEHDAQRGLTGSMSESMLATLHAAHPERMEALVNNSEAFKERVQAHLDEARDVQSSSQSDIRRYNKTRDLYLNISGCETVEELKEQFGSDEQAKSDVNQQFDTAKSGQSSEAVASNETGTTPKPGSMNPV